MHLKSLMVVLAALTAVQAKYEGPFALDVAAAITKHDIEKMLQKVLTESDDIIEEVKSLYREESEAMVEHSKENLKGVFKAAKEMKSLGVDVSHCITGVGEKYDRISEDFSTSLRKCTTEELSTYESLADQIRKYVAKLREDEVFKTLPTMAVEECKAKGFEDDDEEGSDFLNCVGEELDSYKLKHTSFVGSLFREMVEMYENSLECFHGSHLTPKTGARTTIVSLGIVECMREASGRELFHSVFTPPDGHSNGKNKGERNRVAQ